MFGYVTPCRMELKIKDFEKFKAYYCGVCKSIKDNYGNIPRASLNYDMTFLAILIDSLETNPLDVKLHRCAVHPLKKRLYIANNNAVSYASKMNINLAHYKFLDDLNDEKSLKFSLLYRISRIYVNKDSSDLNNMKQLIKDSLDKLSNQEKDPKEKNIDSLSDSFAHLTACILSEYKFKDESFKQDLYWLGYNLGKWIYIIDAMDDLEEDMKKNRFNAINHCFNEQNMTYKALYDLIKNRVEFILISCGSQCLDYFHKLPLNRNHELLENILKYGLMEKMDMIFNPEQYKKNNIYKDLQKGV
ncbi:hypothetical protein KQI89_13920 [Clostridium sp. MSJ-4]|uniref:Uncharacterized protein n=1 Tax=Clostridium simiarum TaxID=2841506 RepID=A0ABS6F2W3_9CLOT|nr:DUF5685 family protein [Clostridium simiarum]MBU5592846.1 hypothetical protein [Clostridium simiarum]